jgi:hypothetical protein
MRATAATPRTRTQEILCRILHMDMGEHAPYTQVRKQGTSAYLLHQRQLDVRLPTKRGGEPDLRGVVSMSITPGDACCRYCLGFLEHAPSRGLGE